MSDTFRKQYKQLTEEEKQKINEVKELAEKLEAIYEDQKAKGKNLRHFSLAITKLEESVMWAVKGMT